MPCFLFFLGVVHECLNGFHTDSKIDFGASGPQLVAERLAKRGCSKRADHLGDQNVFLVDGLELEKLSF